MPASQYRTSVRSHQNKPHDSLTENLAIIQDQAIVTDHSAMADKIRRFGNHINRALNTHEELNRKPCQTITQQQGILAPLLMLISQIRLTEHQSSTIYSPQAITVRVDLPYHFSQNDSLRFPVTTASSLLSTGTASSLITDVTQNVKHSIYIITDVEKKNNLLASVIKYFVADGQLSVDDSANFELWLRSEASGAPILIAQLGNEEINTTRTKRALLRALDPRTGEHIREHCAFEEEVLNANGENEGKLLLFQAQRAENPFRMIYDNRDNVAPSPVERGIALGLDISTNILTLGIKPLIGNIIAHAKRREYYKNQGDEICAERYRRLLAAEVLTSLDDGGLSYQSSLRTSSRIVKPRELLSALPLQERAAFYTHNSHSGITTEILLEIKQGKTIINNNGHKIYLKPTEKKNEFFTYHPYAVKPKLLEKRVIVDENNLSWRFADEFDSSNLNIEISDGKRQIKLHGEYYELQKNADGKYEIVINKSENIKEFVPVYIEPLSRTWHLSIYNEHAVFSNEQATIIKEIKVKPEEGFDYIPRGNNNPQYYGTGNIYVQEKRGDYSHYPWGRYVEMNGELVPVRNTKHQGQGVLYEVYDLKIPEKEGHPIEWDGNRWLFERKTSVHVSEELRNKITADMYSKNIDLTTLSAPDHRGLRIDVRGNKYLKINDNFVQVYHREQIYFIKKNNNDNVFIDFKRNEFIPHQSKVTSKFNARKLANIDISKLDIHPVSGYKNIYVSSNGHLYIKINNKHYPVDFAGKDRRVLLIGSPNEIRFACIYKPENGSVKKIIENLGNSLLIYNKDIDIYIGTDIITEKKLI